MLLLDSCHSGEVDPEFEQKSLNLAAAIPGATVTATRAMRAKGIGVVQSKLKANLATSFQVMRDYFVATTDTAGANVLAAAGGLEYALESDVWSNGVFTYSVMEALRDDVADKDGNGNVALSELHDYVSQRVQELTGGGQ